MTEKFKQKLQAKLKTWLQESEPFVQIRQFKAAADVFAKLLDKRRTRPLYRYACDYEEIIPDGWQVVQSRARTGNGVFMVIVKEDYEPKDFYPITIGNVVYNIPLLPEGITLTETL